MKVEKKTKWRKKTQFNQGVHLLFSPLYKMKKLTSNNRKIKSG